MRSFFFFIFFFAVVVQAEDYLKEGLKNGLAENYDGQRNSTNAFSRAFDFAQVYVSI